MVEDQKPLQPVGSGYGDEAAQQRREELKKERLAQLSNQKALFKNPQPGEWLASDLSKNRVANYYAQTIVDGEGYRASIYYAGCPFHCVGCWNANIWDFQAGYPYTQELEDQIIEDIRPAYMEGLSHVGGEPFLNTTMALPLSRRIREEYGDSKTIWSWSGYYFEELLEDSPDKLELLSLIDVLVDGRFDLSKRDLTLQFRGSSNQRIIDVPHSLKCGRVILWRNSNGTPYR